MFIQDLEVFRRDEGGAPYAYATIEFTDEDIEMLLKGLKTVTGDGAVVMYDLLKDVLFRMR